MTNDKVFPFIKQANVSFLSDSWKKLPITEPSLLGDYSINLLKGCLFCFSQAAITGSSGICQGVLYTRNGTAFFTVYQAAQLRLGRGHSNLRSLPQLHLQIALNTPVGLEENKTRPSFWPLLAYKFIISK